MNSFLSALKSEPNVVFAFVQSLIGLGTAFGLHWSAEQVAAVLVVTQIGLSLVTRQMVTPNVKPVA
jgi:ribosomal protein L7Ae-like RNA K-turn-binding protein